MEKIRCVKYLQMIYRFFQRFMTNKSISELNADLEKISYSGCQWNMQFNPDPNKQANEVILSQKPYSDNLSYSPIKFNNNHISKCPH